MEGGGEAWGVREWVVGGEGVACVGGCGGVSGGVGAGRGKGG